MSSNASSYTLGYQSSISYATITSGTAGSYSKVAQTRDISSPMPKIGKVNITNNDSPGNSKEYAPGMADPDTVEFDVVWASGQHLTVIQMAGDRIIRSWQEHFPDGTTATFPGYVESAGIEGKTEDDALTGKVSIQMTGPVVWAAGTPS